MQEIFTARAKTLPQRYLISPQIFAAEQARIFSTQWLCVGHQTQIPGPGAYLLQEVSDESLIILRDQQGKVRGFYNVCRHRAGPPAEGCGSRKLFRCGYHGWTYGLDGSLISVTEIDGVEGFRPEDFSLVPVRTEEWFNLVFVNLDPAARPLRESLGELTNFRKDVGCIGGGLYFDVAGVSRSELHVLTQRVAEEKRLLGHKTDVTPQRFEWDLTNG